RWDRTRLRPALARHGDVAAVDAALREYRWLDAHRALSNHLAHGGSQFVIRPADRRDILARIPRRFPSAADHAAQRARRLLAGRHDLLGYRDLDFRGPDWHYDPVHDRRMPLLFWSRVPYLDPACGDHKIVWELNRHQHWLALGRAYWLTGDRRFRRRF